MLCPQCSEFVIKILTWFSEEHCDFTPRTHRPGRLWSRCQRCLEFPWALEAGSSHSFKGRWEGRRPSLLCHLVPSRHDFRLFRLCGDHVLKEKAKQQSQASISIVIVMPATAQEGKSSVVSFEVTASTLPPCLGSDAGHHGGRRGGFGSVVLSHPLWTG